MKALRHIPCTMLTRSLRSSQPLSCVLKGGKCT